MLKIALASDNNYAPYLATTMLSALAHSTQSIDFYILDLGISSENKVILNKISNNIKFIAVPIDDFNSLPKTISYISSATYARLKIAEYILDCDQIIYLDIDTLVCQDLLPLWQTSLNDNWLGACFDAYVEYEHPYYKQTIGLADQQYYFNAGILLIDLEKWRSRNIFEDATKWLEQHPDILYQDQDILNGLFAGKVKYLNTRYNFMPTQRNRMKAANKSKLNLVCYEKTAFPVAIFHYCGSNKAWQKEGMGSLNADVYLKIFYQHKHLFPESWHKKFHNPSLVEYLYSLIKRLRFKYIYKIF
mgnify:FL=1